VLSRWHHQHRAEGQIAVGGIGATAARLPFPSDAPFAVAASLVSAAAAGAVWAGFAAAIHLGRRVHEVLTTLLLNFVALLLVQRVLTGRLGCSVPAFFNRMSCRGRRGYGACRVSARIPAF
jgi:simple sugar transport system permease protein